MKKLRSGWTTGTCATAAALAVVHYLETSVFLEEVVVTLPKGDKTSIGIHTLKKISENRAFASVIKDGGDDQDVTHGLEIKVTVTRRDLCGGDRPIRILGGIGVGQVTKGGLSIPIGEPAINPVPREMITSHLQPYCTPNKGFEVLIEVPEGQRAALKTFNARLGIMGGISIIGTSGKVEPMSEEGFKASLEVALKQAITLGETTLHYVFGNYGESYAKARGVSEMSILKMSNFVGFMLDRAVYYGAKKIVVIGNIGKLIKVASGSFHTHSHYSDGKFETLVAHLALMGAPVSLLEAVTRQVTTEGVVALLDQVVGQEGDYRRVYQRIADAAKRRCLERVRGEIAVEVVLFSDQQRFLAATDPLWKPPSCPVVLEAATLSVVGIGPGHVGLLTLKGQQILLEADLVIGAKRHLESLKGLIPTGTETLESKGYIDEVRRHIDRALDQGRRKIAVLASGDPLIYGIGQKLREAYLQTTIISGISAIQYFFTMLPFPLQDVLITSSHGRPFDVGLAINNPVLAMVTDQKIHPGVIAKALAGLDQPFKGRLYIGRNLGYPDESLIEGSPDELKDYQQDGLHVVVIVNAKGRTSTHERS